MALRKRRISGLQMGILIRLVMAGEEQRMVQTLSENEGAKRQSLEYHRDNTKNNRLREPELRKDRGEKQGVQAEGSGKKRMGEDEFDYLDV